MLFPGQDFKKSLYPFKLSFFFSWLAEDDDNALGLLAVQEERGLGF